MTLAPQNSEAPASWVATQSRAPQFFSTNLEALRKLLLSATETHAVSLCLPLASTTGHYVDFRVTRAPFAHLPEGFEFTAFKGVRVNHPTDYARFSLGPNGLDGLIISPNGISVIEPGTTGTHAVSYRSDLDWTTSTLCRTDGTGEISLPASVSEPWPSLSLTIAPYISRNYALLQGGVSHQTLGRVLTSLNIVAGILEHEANVELKPYLDTSLIDMASVKTHDAAQTFIDDAIGTHNYDIGHRFLGTGQDGVSRSNVCDPKTKAHAETRLVDSHLNVELLAHEILHQLGATHTFNGSGFGDRRSGGTAYEPGDGSSLLSYAGVTGGHPLQANRRDYHLLPQTVQQIRERLVRCGCPTRQRLADPNNRPPAFVHGQTHWVIPKGLPFTLAATVVDLDGQDDIFVVRWEGDDVGSDADLVPPLFRALWKQNGATRSFPAAAFAAHLSPPLGERRPQTAMNLRFTAFARDRSFGIARAAATVKVLHCGPIVLTRPKDVEQGKMLHTTWSWASGVCDSEQQRPMRISLLVGDPLDAVEVPLPDTVSLSKGQVQVSADVPNLHQPTIARLKLAAIGNIYYVVSPSFTINP